MYGEQPPGLTVDRQPAQDIRRGYGRVAAAALYIGLLAACGRDEYAGSRPGQSGAVTLLPPVSTTMQQLPVETSTTTTTEYAPQPGEVIAKVTIPRMCSLEADVIQFAPGESKRVDVDSSIDNNIPDDVPQPDCPEAEQHAENMRQQNPDYATRGQRTNAGYPAYLDRNGNGTQEEDESYDGKANAFIPLLGQYPGSPGPGETGNNVWFGHRTTKSAPLALIDMLQHGDEIKVESRGRQFTYTVTGVEAVEAWNDHEDKATTEKRALEHILRPPGHEEARMLTLFACEPQRDDRYRLVVRAQLNDEKKLDIS